MANEPESLRRGKAFHERVQSDWEHTAEGNVRRERTIPLIPKEAKRIRHGRMDLFVDGFDDMVVVVEIKGTDWDRVQHVRKLLSAHRRQIWKYIEKHVDEDGMDVCPGMIYPAAPTDPELRKRVERYLNEHGVQVVWYEE